MSMFENTMMLRGAELPAWTKGEHYENCEPYAVRKSVRKSLLVQMMLTALLK